MGFKMKGYSPFTQSKEDSEEAIKEYLAEQQRKQESEDSKMWIHKQGSYTGRRNSPMNQNRPRITRESLKDVVDTVKDKVEDLTTTTSKSDYKPPVVPNFKGGGLGEKIKNFFTKNTPTHKYQKWDKTFSRNNPPITIPRAKFDSIKKVDGNLKFDYKYNVGTDSLREGTHSMNMKKDFYRIGLGGKRPSKKNNYVDSRNVTLMPKTHYDVSDILYEKAESSKWGLNAQERKDALNKKKDPRLKDEQLDKIWKRRGPGRLGGELTGR